MFELETGVEVPRAVRVHTKGESKYPFAQMNVGHSFAVPVGEVPSKTLSTMRTTAYRYGSEHKTKFAVRLMDTVVRVWRIA